MISDKRVFTSQSARMIRNSGTAVTIAGNIRVERIQSASFRSRFHGSRNLASAYAAKVPITSAQIVDATATNRLLKRYCPNDRLIKASA